MKKSKATALKQGRGSAASPGFSPSPGEAAIRPPAHKHPSHCVPKNTFCPELSLERSKVLASMVWWWKYKFLWVDGNKLFYYPLNKAVSFHCSSRTRRKRFKTAIGADIRYLVSTGWLYEGGLKDLGDGIIKKWYGLGAKTMLRLARVTRGQEHIIKIGKNEINIHPTFTRHSPRGRGRGRGRGYCCSRKNFRKFKTSPHRSSPCRPSPRRSCSPKLLCTNHPKSLRGI